jgi:hypothetical protein
MKNYSQYYMIFILRYMSNCSQMNGKLEGVKFMKPLN